MFPFGFYFMYIYIKPLFPRKIQQICKLKLLKKFTANAYYIYPRPPSVPLFDQNANDC